MNHKEDRPGIQSDSTVPNFTQQELTQYKTKGGKLKTCELTLHWPEEMKFTASATNRATAERMAAALACLRFKVRMGCLFVFYFDLNQKCSFALFSELFWHYVQSHVVQELELLDKNNNPLTHAMYNIDQVQEAKKRHRRPPALDIPQYLQENIKEYLAQVSFLLRRQLEGFSYFG